MLAFIESLSIKLIYVYAFDDHRFDDENRCFGRSETQYIKHCVSGRRQPGVRNVRYRCRKCNLASKKCTIVHL